VLFRSVAYYDADQKFYYLKRFQLELLQKPQSLLGENAKSELASISDADFPRFELVFGGHDAHRSALEIDAESFIGVKSFKARGKRLATFEVKTIKELEPLRFAEKAEEDNSPDGNGENDEELENIDVENAEMEDDLADDLVEEEIHEEKVGKKAEEPKKSKPDIQKNNSVLPDDIVDNPPNVEDGGQMSLF